MAHAKRDLLSGGFALLFGLFILLVSFTIGKTRLAGVGPDYLPRAVGIYIVGLSVIMLVTTLVKLKTGQPAPAAEETTSSKKVEIRTVVLTICVLIAYVLLLEPVGFILVSAIFLFGQMFILAPDGQRKVLLFAVLSLIIPVAVYLLFVNVFSLMLPSGILG